MTIETPHILHEDNHLLAVDKPAGRLVQGDRSGDPTLLDDCRAYLKAKYEKPGNVYLGLVHRLDRPVSGVVLLARTSKAASRLSARFREGEAHKTYLAVVEGCPERREAELVHWLSARGDVSGRTRCEASPFAGAKESVLRYRVLSSGARSLVRVEPVTGRRHQIRVQLAAAGCPIVGDRKYGAPMPLPDRRVALHARRLEIAHPVGGRIMRFEAPLPGDDPWTDFAEETT